MLDEAAKRLAGKRCNKPTVTERQIEFSIVYQSIPFLRKTIFDFSLKVGNLKVRTCSWRMWNSWIAVLVFCSMRILFVTFWPVSVGFYNITPSLFWPQASFSKRFKHEGHAQPMQQMLRSYWKQRTSETLKSKARWRSEERIKIIYEIVMKLWHWSRQSAFSTSQQHGSLSRWID